MIVSGLSSLRVIAYQGRCQMCLQRQPFDLRVHSVCLIVQALSYMAKLTLPRCTHSDSLQRYDCVSVSQNFFMPFVTQSSCASGLVGKWPRCLLQQRSLSQLGVCESILGSLSLCEFQSGISARFGLICSSTTANVNFLQFPPELNLFAGRSGWQLVHNWLATAPGVFCTTRCLSQFDCPT